MRDCIGAPPTPGEIANLNSRVTVLESTDVSQNSRLSGLEGRVTYIEDTCCDTSGSVTVPGDVISSGGEFHASSPNAAFCIIPLIKTGIITSLSIAGDYPPEAKGTFVFTVYRGYEQLSQYTVTNPAQGIPFEVNIPVDAGQYVKINVQTSTLINDHVYIGITALMGPLS